MHLDDIIHRYQEHPELSAFSEQVKGSTEGKFQVKGLAGSQPAFITAALYRQTQRNIVIVLNDKEEALYFHNDLKALMPKKHILLFPASLQKAVSGGGD